ncbi:LysR family transcriptional regulator [Burkholderia sp. LMG 32019]|uniref:LysR family transcriptional regulator n=1 Tax=Burkholderia sp. LMG 32019 TaxID=3158173 RepID=UPI003C2AB030
MDLRRLSHFLLLAEELSFTRAAERAHLSQTAFSRSIQALEAEFGTRLFDRDTRSVTLTLVGRRLATRSKKLLAEAGDIARELSLISLVEAGDLSFGVSPLAMDSVLRRSIVDLTRRYPKLRLNIETANWTILLQQLEEERIEFFVAFPGQLASDPKFSVRPLCAQSASIFCRPQHPLVLSKEPIVASGLLPYPWAAVQFSDDVLALLRQMCGLDDHAPLPVALSCGDTNLLREVTVNTDTLLFTWYDWLRADLDAGRLIDVGSSLKPSLNNSDSLLRRGVVQLAGRTCSPAAQAAIQIIESSSAAIASDA